ncbi:MAG: exo-alpha-sialidase [Cyclobacteriaceae bacterium]|nr:exo-alpha-sialidase [Cyclobacteriaceae bacterium]
MKMYKMISLALLTLLAIACQPPAETPDIMNEVSLVAVDLSQDESRRVVVDREEGQYLGHISTILLEDGKTIFASYPKGHGRGPAILKRSDDGGLTWSDRLPTPQSWETSRETPTLKRVIDAEGNKRIILWSGLYPIRMAYSEDDGDSWTELAPVGDWGGITVMGFTEALLTGQGHYMAMFHDDGRFIKGGPNEFWDSPAGEKTGAMTLYTTFSHNGGMSWSYPEEIFTESEVHLCEPGVIRSPDGKQLAVLLRENRRLKNSFVIFSNDEGKTWSEPRELPLALTGDRHTAKYAPDGRLFVCFRVISPENKRENRPFETSFGGWVGTYEDIVNGNEGQYTVKLGQNYPSSSGWEYDTTYPGVEVLPDGTFVITTYGHWEPETLPYIISVRFTLDEIDALANNR